MSEFFKTGYRYFYDKAGPKTQTGARPPSLAVVGTEEDGVSIPAPKDKITSSAHARRPPSSFLSFPRHARKHQHLVRVLGLSGRSLHLVVNIHKKGCGHRHHTYVSASSVFFTLHSLPTVPARSTTSSESRCPSDRHPCVSQYLV